MIKKFHKFITKEMNSLVNLGITKEILKKDNKKPIKGIIKKNTKPIKLEKVVNINIDKPKKKTKKIIKLFLPKNHKYSSYLLVFMGICKI